jgi:hypothetical protein
VRAEVLAMSKKDVELCFSIVLYDTLYISIQVGKRESFILNSRYTTSQFSHLPTRDLVRQKCQDCFFFFVRESQCGRKNEKNLHKEFSVGKMKKSFFHSGVLAKK